MISESDISVIICAYTEERWDLLVEAIHSLRSQVFPPHEIIIVIDHNPNLLERVKSHFPDLKVIENLRLRGISGSRNSGISVVSGEIIAFLDDDAIAESDWLGQLRQCYSNPDVIGVGGSIFPLWQSNRPKWLPEEFLWIIGCDYKGLPQGITPVRNMIGCNMSLRRESLNGILGFREEIGRTKTSPGGCDETELCIRLRQKTPNKIFLYNPYAKVYHYVPANRVCWNYFSRRCFMEGQSKALVTSFVGVKDGLSSERIYIYNVLPLGIGQGIKDFLVHCDTNGIARSCAIFIGLVFTTAGYVWGLLKNSQNRTTKKEKAIMLD